MPVLAWVALGVCFWAGLLAVLLTVVKRDRRRASQSLGDLGLTVVATTVVNANSITAPRLVAQGSYRGIGVMVEDFPVPRQGGRDVHTRIRTTATHPVPHFVIAAHSYVERSSSPTASIVAVQPDFDRQFETLAEDPASVDGLRNSSALMASKTTGVGSLIELRASGGQLVAILAGAPVDADGVRPVLDAMAEIIPS